MKFHTVVIDPPWPYYIHVTPNYASAMTLERMASLPVRDLVDGYVFLWTTGPYLVEAFDLVKAWGFERKSMVYWVKTTMTGKVASSIGYWFRSSVEPVIVAAAPGVRAVRTNESAAIVSQRRGHSTKPEAFQDMVEKHFPGPYLEMFARRERPGWTCIGGEISGNDILVDMEALKEKDPDEWLAIGLYQS
jgi:N6-adenosine-specific RNA methylase IME4